MPELSSGTSATNFSTETDAAGGGQFVPESVVSLPWNRWSLSHGIGGQFPPESVVSLDRNTQIIRIPHTTKNNISVNLYHSVNKFHTDKTIHSVKWIHSVNLYLNYNVMK